jgi:hypothetical protein
MKSIRKPVENLKELIREDGGPVQKVQYFFKDMEERKRQLATLADRFSGTKVTSSVPMNIEINAANASKGPALEALCKHLGFTAENAAAFGDNTNDLPLLKAAGTSVAVANAVPQVKEWATYVAKENLATPFGLEAYVVSAVTETAITAKSVSYIPVGVGILLKRSVAGVTSYKGEAYEGTPENMASLLKGSATAATDVTAYKDFVLYRDEFVMSSASSIAAGRACLPAASAPAGASRLDIVIDGNLTGVNGVIGVKEVKEVNDGSFYDLSGRKVAQPTTKGVYINNGRKVVVR